MSAVAYLSALNQQLAEMRNIDLSDENLGLPEGATITETPPD